MKLKSVTVSYNINGNPRTAVFCKSCEKGGAAFDISFSDDRFILNIRSDASVCLNEVCAEFEFEYRDDFRLFFNGYQSWTDSREQTIDGRMYRLNKFPKFLVKKFHLTAYGDIDFVRYGRKKGQMHGFSYAYVRDGGDYTLFGSLCENTGFTVIRCDTSRNLLTFEKECKGHHFTGEYKALDIAICKGTEDEVFNKWFALLGINPPCSKRINGYTSWYNHYDRITEAAIEKDLDAFKTAGIKPDVFQIDDGYQQKVGDWLCVDVSKFKSGMKAAADSIREQGITPGLWLAPFAAAKDSRLANEHPDLLVCDDDEKPVICGGNWGGFYALDIYNEKVRDYLQNVFDTVINKWGFGLVKLDFLYAACILPRRDKTRGEIMHDAMVFLREVCGDALILGCGVPLASAFGLVDYCRIGCDVSLKWDDEPYARFMHRERISTRNTLLDTIYRRQLDGRAFRNDPDVFLLRSENIHLNDRQKYTLAVTNALFGGVLFTSDNVAEYDECKRKLYDMTASLDKSCFISAVTDGKVTELTFTHDGRNETLIIK